MHPTLQLIAHDSSSSFMPLYMSEYTLDSASAKHDLIIRETIFSIFQKWVVEEGDHASFDTFVNILAILRTPREKRTEGDRALLLHWYDVLDAEVIGMEPHEWGLWTVSSLPGEERPGYGLHYVTRAKRREEGEGDVNINNNKDK